MLLLTVFLGKDRVIEITLQAFGFSCAILHRIWSRVSFSGFRFPILLSGFGGWSVTGGLIVVSVPTGYSEFIAVTIIIYKVQAS